MRNVRKNLNAYVDGRGYAGQVEDFNAPKLALKKEAFQGGGMAAPVSLTMGFEELESDFSLLAYDADILALWNVVEGKEVQFTVRELLESSNGDQKGVVHSMRGKITEIDPGTSKPGEKATMKISMSVTYYKLTHGARVVHEIDVLGMVHVVDGVDLLAAARNILAR